MYAGKNCLDHGCELSLAPAEGVEATDLRTDLVINSASELLGDAACSAYSARHGVADVLASLMVCQETREPTCRLLHAVRAELR